MSDLTVAAWVFGALVSCAIFYGLREIAAAIRTRTIKIVWTDPIVVNHQHEVSK